MWVLVQINSLSSEREASGSSHGRALSSAPALRPCFSVLGGNRDPASRVLLAARLVPSAVLAFLGPREEAALGPTPSGTCRA